jgi:hypothetical protein
MWISARVFSSERMLEMRRWIQAIVLLSAAAASQAQHTDFPNRTGPYLGQKPPGLTPEIFAPGMISMGYFERSVVFSPTQDELFFQLRCLGFTTILLHMERTGGQWTGPETAFFSGVPEYNDDCPFFTCDGRRLFFVSKRPVSGKGEIRKDADIWMLPRIGKDWGGPLHAGKPLNSAFDDDYPTLSRSDDLYFSSNREGNYDIYTAHFSGTGFSQPLRLNAEINTTYFEGHPFIAADGSYLIFSSDRPGEREDGDLYIGCRGQEEELRPNPRSFPRSP